MAELLAAPIAKLALSDVLKHPAMIGAGIALALSLSTCGVQTLRLHHEQAVATKANAAASAAAQDAKSAHAALTKVTADDKAAYDTLSQSCAQDHATAVKVGELIERSTHAPPGSPRPPIAAPVLRCLAGQAPVDDCLSGKPHG